MMHECFANKWKGDTDKSAKVPCSTLALGANTFGDLYIQELEPWKYEEHSGLLHMNLQSDFERGISMSKRTRWSPKHK